MTFRRCVLWMLVVAVVLLFGEWRQAGWATEVPSPCAVYHPSDQWITWNCRRLQKGETLEKLFGQRWVDVARFNRIDRRHAQPGREIKIPSRLDDVVDFTPLPQRYSAGSPEARLIVVDLTEQFLGAYEEGVLRFSFPIASGEPDNPTPAGDFRITAAHRAHQSCLYTIEGTDVPYPMQYALRFYINPEGVSYWIHGRDLPGYPASHGCIGLSDEEMQVQYYGVPFQPRLNDAKRLYEWVVGNLTDVGAVQTLSNGPRMVIQGTTPKGNRTGRAVP